MTQPRATEVQTDLSPRAVERPEVHVAAAVVVEEAADVEAEADAVEEEEEDAAVVEVLEWTSDRYTDKTWPNPTISLETFFHDSHQSP